jgi:hypothetical protein
MCSSSDATNPREQEPGYGQCVYRALSEALAYPDTELTLLCEGDCSFRAFDDYTHVTVYSDRSLCDFLVANGFAVLECRPRFLPLTLKSRLPISALLIRLYLLSPWKILGKQMLVRCTPS